jgi:predicted regulator of Ras-like GTPase activity (Roadblock/LC7/MglB family)
MIKMTAEIEAVIDELVNEEQNIFGVAIISQTGSIITQTENWDLSSNLNDINALLQTKLGLGQKGMSSITIQGIKYMLVENTEERKIGTNITGKGHVIIAPIPIGGDGALICYINPQVGPRDALFTIQTYALRLSKLI